MTQGESEVAAVKRIVIGGLIVFIALMLWSGAPAQAQGTQPVWGAPFNVSDSRDASVDPFVACDLFGNVHVFWSEKTQGEPSENPGAMSGTASSTANFKTENGLRPLT